MTDFEKVAALFTELGITYEANANKTSIEIRAKEGTVKGYLGFYTNFYFAVDGKFLTVGIWE